MNCPKCEREMMEGNGTWACADCGIVLEEDGSIRAWGQKTLKPNSPEHLDALKKVNVARAMHYISNVLSEANLFDDPNLGKSGFTEAHRTEAKQKIDNFLASLMDRKGINDFGTSARAMTMKDVYPRWRDRTMARLGFLLGKLGVMPQHANEYKWYHFVFPFKRVEHIVFNEHGDDYPEHSKIAWDYVDSLDGPDEEADAWEIWDDYPPKSEWMLEWLERNKPFLHREVSLVNPKTMMMCEISIQPVRPMEYIKMDMILTPNGQAIMEDEHA